MGSEENETIRLKRRFGLGSCVAILVGFIIGSGIYIAPSGVLRNVTDPGVALLLWLVAGLVSLLSGLVNAELGVTYPVSGDRYVYLQIFFGDFMGFLHLWQYLLITRPGANTIKCLIFAQYITYPLFPDCAPPPGMSQLIAAALACFVTAVNCVNVTWAGKMQSFCACMTVLALLIMTITGFVHIGQGQSGDLVNAFASTRETEFGGVILAVYSLIYTYGGWFALNYMVEELKEPHKNLPRAITISMVIVILLYLAVNVAYIAVMGVDDIQQSEAVAMTFSQRTLGAFSWVIALMIAINTSGSLNAGILVGSRLCFAGARHGHLPAILSGINIRSLSPVTALLMQLVIMVLMCFLIDIYTLLNNFVFLNCTVDMLVTYGLLYRRLKDPHRSRPLKLPLALVLTSAVISSVIVFGPLVTKPMDTAIGLVIVLSTGIPYYLLFFKKWLKLGHLEKYNRSLTQAVQKALWCVPEDASPAES